MKCTYSAYPVVAIVIEGKPHMKGAPYYPDDGGLITEFLQWLGEEGIYHLPLGSTCGCGRYRAFFGAEDAAKIEAWLKGRARQKEKAK